MQENNITYKQFEHAYLDARTQAHNHAKQVSGTWSISGKDFCKEYGLDYEKALDYERMLQDDDLDMAYHQEEHQIEKKIGTLSPGQQSKLLEWVSTNCQGLAETYHFWTHLQDQLVSKYPEHYQHYLKGGDGE